MQIMYKLLDGNAHITPVYPQTHIQWQKNGKKYNTGLKFTYQSGWNNMDGLTSTHMTWQQSLLWYVWSYRSISADTVL